MTTLNLPTAHPEKEPVASTRTKIVISAAIGLAIGGLAGSLLSWRYAPLICWDAAAIVFLTWTGLTVHGRDAQATANLAVREDPGRGALDILLVLASVASLAAVGGLLYQAESAHESVRLGSAAMGIVSVVLSWTVIHTLYTLRYARLYYQRNGGIDFNDAAAPRYSDFAYLAFTIGMTFQVSDSTFKNNEFRTTALRHALLSFLFGTTIVAATINLLAGLGR